MFEIAFNRGQAVVDMVHDGLRRCRLGQRPSLVDFGEVARVGDRGSVTEAVVKHLPADSPVPGYLRRLLLADREAGRVLFRRLFGSAPRPWTRWPPRAWPRRGRIPPVRAAFLLINDLTVLLLRDRLAEVLGTDPLSGPGMARWAGEVLAIYGAGLLTAPPPAAR